MRLAASTKKPHNNLHLPTNIALQLNPSPLTLLLLSSTHQTCKLNLDRIFLELKSSSFSHGHSFTIPKLECMSLKTPLVVGLCYKGKRGLPITECQSFGNSDHFPIRNLHFLTDGQMCITTQRCTESFSIPDNQTRNLCCD
jgi:hypothetical protein